jgi:hypothetical protein
MGTVAPTDSIAVGQRYSSEARGEEATLFVEGTVGCLEALLLWKRCAKRRVSTT